MKTISIREAVKGLQVKGKTRFNTDLFKADSETLESFNAGDYDYIIQITSDVHSDQSKFIETFVATINEDGFLITAVHQMFGGEIQTAIYSKWLTLKGFNYFVDKATITYDEMPYEIKDFYNRVLLSEGYDISYDDILELGEYSPEYKCKSLRFEIDDIKHSLTINEKGYLSSIKKTVKEIVNIGKAKPQQSFKSILG